MKLPEADSVGPRVAMVADTLEGGAGRAARRLFTALKDTGLSVDLLHFYGDCQGIESVCLDGRNKRPTFERALKNVSRPAADKLRRARHLQALERSLSAKPYDLLHLHNLHACGVQSDDLAHLSGGRPILWTLHDEYALFNRAFPVEGEASPELNPALLSLPDLSFIGPSAWICREARLACGNKIPVHHVPYGLSQDEFVPLDPTQCRQELGLEANALWIGFGGGCDPRKGGDVLLEASRNFPKDMDIRLLAWGKALPQLSHRFKEIRQLPFFRKSHELNKAYTACDLMMVPSREDNFPLVVLESLASGTPVAASLRGGSCEAVVPGSNGCHIHIEPRSMAEDLEPFLNRDKLEGMREKARSSFATQYISELEAEAVLALYQSLVD